MATQRQELSVITPQPFIVRPSSFHEMQEYCEYLSKSSLCPEAIRGRAADVFMIVQTGAELGLHAVQSLKTFGIINGMPFAYGDGFLSLIKKHKDFEDMKLWFEGKIDDRTLTAFCQMKRKNQSPITESFSMRDADRAGLLSKGGKSAWSAYTNIMLQRRAIAKVGKFTFPDALYGIPHEDDIARQEEKSDTVKLKGKGMKGLEATLGIEDDEENNDHSIIEGEFIQECEIINSETDPINDAIIAEVKALIIEKNVPEKSVNKWCKQFNVDTIEGIPIEDIKKIINHIKEK